METTIVQSFEFKKLRIPQIKSLLKKAEPFYGPKDNEPKISKESIDELIKELCNEVF